ncbi:class I SAM-dependent methyltransferase [Candidatus Protochlamydia sp. R18]|uniref:class I SAM-dependent methyltransferase n=1 Tax=Candidatus Protochlamydia sp. R18 TaxID=1353977 RepID=UPI0005A5F048|nr:class I SAM-dependent methyltransferase [Candidatus Protochlamydia sp. R18]
MTKNRDTSWNSVGRWYDNSVGEQGHYYHQQVIIPQVTKLLNFSDQEQASLLDLACGQGVLSRHLPSQISYTGIDLAKQLITAARQHNRRAQCDFFCADVTEKLPIQKVDFSHATIILALQNIQFPLKVFQNASKHLKPLSPLVIVINHPCFRIPRQSSWKIDTENKIQYRRMDRYMSEMKIPIQMHPGQGTESQQTWSFHHPLSTYTYWLQEAGFTLDRIEEWCSNKISEGKAAKMENRAREEFPLFMALIARKKG